MIENRTTSLTLRRLLTAVVFLAAPAAGLAADTGDPGSRMPLLMPDDFSEMEVCAWRVEPAVPDPNNPLLEGEMPWDAGGIMTHGTVLRDPLDGIWKAWLLCTPPDVRLETLGMTAFDMTRRLCYFESTDGVSWTRPKLPESAFSGYGETNIVFDDTDNGGAQYASVSVLPDKQPWPYEMFVYRNTYGPGKPGYTHLHHYRSREGKKWDLVGGPIRGPMSTDVCYVYPDPTEGYVAYYRLGIPDDDTRHIPIYEGRKGQTRQLFRAVSRDGQTWVDDQKIVRRDERDHRDTQHMELVPHPVPGGILGIFSIYRPLTQTLNLRTGASRDGKQWWFPDRRPCLDNPPLGEYGGGMIWQSKNLVVDGDRLYVYYAGTEGIHRPIFDSRATEFHDIGLDRVINYQADFLPFNSALCRASWRIDRLYALVSAAGGPTLGVATTKPRDLAGKQLQLNFLTRPPKKSRQQPFDEGHLQVELLDAQGAPLLGFSRTDCRPLRGDHRALPVSWRGGDRAPSAARQARFYLKRAYLWGFCFGKPEDSTDQVPANRN